MSLIETLKRAQSLLAGGWAEPLCLDAGGRICTADAEGVASFDVVSALRHCGRTDAGDAVQLLGEVTNAGDGLTAWLERTGRKQEQVLRAFDLAILKARTKRTEAA